MIRKFKLVLKVVAVVLMTIGLSYYCWLKMFSEFGHAPKSFRELINESKVEVNSSRDLSSDLWRGKFILSESKNHELLFATIAAHDFGYPSDLDKEELLDHLELKEREEITDFTIRYKKIGASKCYIGYTENLRRVIISYLNPKY